VFVLVGVIIGVGVHVRVNVRVGVGESIKVGVTVNIGVAVETGVFVEMGVSDGVGVIVGVSVGGEGGKLGVKVTLRVQPHKKSTTAAKAIAKARFLFTISNLLSSSRRHWIWRISSCWRWHHSYCRGRRIPGSSWGLG
jgi:hypothetical protein